MARFSVRCLNEDCDYYEVKRAERTANEAGAAHARAYPDVVHTFAIKELPKREKPKSRSTRLSETLEDFTRQKEFAENLISEIDGHDFEKDGVLDFEGRGLVTELGVDAGGIQELLDEISSWADNLEGANQHGAPSEVRRGHRVPRRAPGDGRQRGEHRRAGRAEGDRQRRRQGRAGGVREPVRRGDRRRGERVVPGDVLMPREYLFRRVRPNGGIDVELRVQRDGEGLVIGLADEESGAIVIELRRDDVAGLHDRLGKWLAVTPKAERASD